MVKQHFQTNPNGEQKRLNSRVAKGLIFGPCSLLREPLPEF